MHKKEYCISSKLVQRTFRVASRNAIYAIIGRILIGILKRIGKKGLTVAALRDCSKEICSLDPLKWASILAGLSFFRLFKRIILVLGHFFGVSNKLAALLSGGLCSLPALVMNKETQTDLSLYIFVRALQSFGVGHVLPHLPRPLREFDHYDVLTMCLSASQILYSAVFAPYTMPESYQQFLSRAALLDSRIVRSLAGLARFQITPELVEMCMEKGMELPENAQEHLSIGCRYSHPGMSCNAFWLSFIYKNVCQVGIPLYVPLKIVTILAFQFKELNARPLKVLRSSLRSVLRSSLFLAVYSASTVRFSCFAAQHNIRGGLFTALACSLAGIASLFEPKGRRMDLALYCLMYAMRSFVMTQYRLGWLPYPRHGVVFFLYLSSMSFLFFQYDEEPQALSGRVRTVLAKILDEKESSHSTRSADTRKETHTEKFERHDHP